MQITITISLPHMLHLGSWNTIPAVKQDCFKNYEYVFVYVYDLLVISADPHKIMKGISQINHMKDGSIMEPHTYLGAQIKKKSVVW